MKDTRVADDLRRRVTRMFEQLTQGCGYPTCTNPWCASSARRSPEVSAAATTAAAADGDPSSASSAAAALALRLASQPAPPFCAPHAFPPPLSLAELRSLAAAARAGGGVVPVVRRVGAVFGSPESLRMSLLPAAADAADAQFETFGADDIVVFAEAYALLRGLDEIAPPPQPQPQAPAAAEPREEEAAAIEYDPASRRRPLLGQSSEGIPPELILGKRGLGLSSSFVPVPGAVPQPPPPPQQQPKQVEEVVVGALARAFSALRANPALLGEPATLRLFGLACECPWMQDPVHNEELLAPFAQCVAVAPEAARDALAQMWARAFTRGRMREAAVTFESAIATRILTHGEDRRRWNASQDSAVVAWVQVLAVLYRANELFPRPTTSEDQPLQFGDWYNSVLCEALDPREDYWKWKFARSDREFSFCRFPFLLDPAYKVKLLTIESAQEQRRQRESVASDEVLFLGPPPFLPIKVRRERLLQDSLSQLEGRDPKEYKKELRVKFAGEDGLDMGGVQREWFALLTKELFDPQYGMFVLDPKTRTFWFNMFSDALADFRLVGMLLGLAIYNSAILDVHFPLVVYKKLKGVEPGLEDLRDTFPDIYAGLVKLLEFEGDVEEVFMLNFQVQYDKYGQCVKRDLIPNGENVPVTAANREEYVRLRVKDLLVDSVKAQFDRFCAGFNLLCNSEAFNLFRAEELELVICGNPELDWRALESSTRYEGFDPRHPLIRAFWEIFHGLELRDKKLFLTFTTGSDRCPVGGLGQLRLVITRHGPDTENLPTASTCFNHLLLPEYSSKEKLSRKLLQAIQNSTGFGLL